MMPVDFEEANITLWPPRGSSREEVFELRACKGWFISAGVEGQYPPSPKPPFAWCGIPDFAGYHEILKG